MSEPLRNRQAEVEREFNAIERRDAIRLTLTIVSCLTLASLVIWAVNSSRELSIIAAALMGSAVPIGMLIDRKFK